MTPRTHLITADPLLAAATDGLELFTTQRPRDPAIALLRAIVGQQLSTTAAATIWARVEAHYGGAPSCEAVLATPAEDLRALGLSWRKASYAHAVAEAARDGAMARERLDTLDDATILAELTAIKGVGRWTVEMLLMFVLHRPDVFPSGDLGVQGAMKAIYGIEGKGRALEKQLEAVAERWRPYRSTGARLMWAYRDRRM